MNVKAVTKAYRQRMSDANEVVIEAWLELYEQITGKQASDSLREKVDEAIKGSVK